MQNLIVFICILVMAIFPASYLLIDSAQVSAETLIFVVSAILLTLMLLVGLVFFLAAPIVRLVFRDTTAKLDAVITEASATLSAYQRSDQAEAIQHGTHALREVAAWYSAGALRRWAFGAVAAVGLVFTGAMGSILLLQQNRLLRDQNIMVGTQLALMKDQNAKIDAQLALMKAQNEKLDTQTALADGQRRTALIAELSNIFNTINTERENWDRFSKDEKFQIYSNSVTQCSANIYENGDDIPLVLSELTTARIAALTRSLSPYYSIEYKDNNLMIDPTLRSPERGQILISLLSARIILEPIFRKATFAYADLRNVELFGSDFCELDATSADFSGSTFWGVSLIEARLSGANFKGAKFRSSKIDLENINNPYWDGAKIIAGHICVREDKYYDPIKYVIFDRISPCIIIQTGAGSNSNIFLQTKLDNEKLLFWENAVKSAFQEIYEYRKNNYTNFRIK